MIVNPIQNQIYQNRFQQNDSFALAQNIGKQVFLPDMTRNYTIFNQPLVNSLVNNREKAIPAVVDVLSKTSEEKVIAEGLYTLDRMIDAGVKEVEKTYPVISRFNNTTSPTVQALLAGIYRKTQVPDGFGPLCKMMVRNSLLPTCPYFDPTEEIGGAILDYLRNSNAQNLYKQG
ncbi:MAG: hypothetical protein PHV68_05705 [Candidatus Gastranaerophilales bacterium]|nr:hypothetical protein [Candidatus Gastranaerophilales bacterium]